MGDGRDLGRIVGRTQSDQSSQAAVDEVFSQWQSIQNDAAQISAFTEELAPYLPQLSVAFLNSTIDGQAITYFAAIDESGDGILQESELQAFSDNTQDGAARMFADYLLQYYSAFDASDGVSEDGINRDNLMRAEAGFFNPADGSYTRLTEDGVFETTYSDGTRMLVRENATALINGTTSSAVYQMAGSPAIALQGNGDIWTVCIDGVPLTSETGMVEHTSEGVVLTHYDGSSITYQADGMISSRDSEGRILSVSQGNETLRRYEYDGGNLVNYWEGNQYFWMDRRPLSGTYGTWYVDHSVDGVTQVSSVSMTSDNATIVFNDGRIKTVHQNGNITWSQDGDVVVDPLTDEAEVNAITGQEVRLPGMSVTQDANGRIVEVVIPPDSTPWRRIDDGDGDLDNDRWVQGVGPADQYDPTIEFSNDENGLSHVTMTFSLDGGGSRQFMRDGAGTLLSVTNPDGSTYQRQEDGSYLYSPVNGEPVLARLNEATGEPVFTILGEPDMTLIAFHSDGAMTSTRLVGDNVYISEEGVQVESTVQMEGRTVTRRDGYIEIVNDDGATTRYSDNHDGTWSMVSGRTDISGNFQLTLGSHPVFVRGGWAEDGTFVLFTDGDQNINTFDPGDTYHRIEANGAVTEQSITNGSITFTDQDGFINSMEFTDGHLSGLAQTTPDGQFQLTAEFADGNIASIRLPDGTQILPVIEGDVVRWQHIGNPPYYLADAPVIGANGQVMLGTSSIWTTQDSSDPLFPGQLILQIRTENGFQYLAMDGSYALGDSSNLAIFDSNDVMVEQFFGNYRVRDEALVLSYENSVLSSVDLPGPAGSYCHMVGGVWVYSDGVRERQLSGAPQINNDSATITLNFASSAEGEPIGIRIGAFPVSEILMPDGIVRNSSVDESIITDTYPSGLVLQLVNGQMNAVTLPNGYSYELVPNSGEPPAWRFTRDGVTETVHGNISYSFERQAVIVVNGDEQTLFQIDGTRLYSIQHTKGSLTTIANLDGDQIVSVTMVDSNNPQDTNQLVARQVDGVTVWHWMHNGVETPLLRNTSVTFDEHGVIVFHNDVLAAGVPLVDGNGQWQIPVRTPLSVTYGADNQLSTVTLSDGQGTWTNVSDGHWQFVGPDGVIVDRFGTFTYENNIVSFVNQDGSSEVYTYADNGDLLSTAFTDINHNVTTVQYQNGEITEITLPANGTMQFQGDFWTISVGENTINLLGTPAIADGQLVMQNSSGTTPVLYGDPVEMQFRTVEGVVRFDASGSMITTDETALLTSLIADSAWIAAVALGDGVQGNLTLNDLHLALNNSNLSESQREVVLYLVENYDRLHPVYDSLNHTLLLVTETGVQLYGDGEIVDRTLTSQELVLMINPNELAPSLWTTLAASGVLTRAELDSMVASGTANGVALTAEQRAAALYLQTHWSEFAISHTEDPLAVEDEIRDSDLQTYARRHGINFPEPVIAAESAATPEGNSESEAAIVGEPVVEIPIVGQPVQLPSLDTVETTAVPASYNAVEWLNQHQLVMRQYMLVDSTGRRTGEIDVTRVNDQVSALRAIPESERTQDEQMLLEALEAMQNYLTAAAESPTAEPPTAEGFFRSVLLSNETEQNSYGARTLGPTDAIWSMARTFLVEQWCHQHGYTQEQIDEQLALIQQGAANSELAGYVAANLQAEIDFIFEANHIVGSNVAVGQLLILDPALAAQGNDAIYLAPQSVNLEAFTELPIEGQSEHVTHLQNQSTGEEAFVLDSGITLTRSTAGTWGAYDENGNLLGMVENNTIDAAAIASGTFTLQLESNDNLPIQTIFVSEHLSTLVFENGTTEQIYNNGVQVFFNQSLEVDQVIVPSATGNLTYTRLVANGVTTGYQVIYPDQSTTTVLQAPILAANGEITFRSSDGQAVTVYADGTTNQSGVDTLPASEVGEDQAAA